MGSKTLLYFRSPRRLSFFLLLTSLFSFRYSQKSDAGTVSSAIRAMLNADESGEMSVDSLSSFLGTLDQSLSKHDVFEIYREMDADGSGSISVQELAHVLCHEPDPVFVAHHVAYLAATLPIVFSERGWALVSLGTLLAEATNPLQLCWELARAYGCEEVYDALSPPFTFGFALCRGVLMPLAMGDMALSLFGRAGARAPPAMRFAYGVFFVGIGASGVWLAQLVRGFRRYRRKKRLNGKPAKTRDRRDSNCI